MSPSLVLLPLLVACAPAPRGRASTPRRAPPGAPFTVIYPKQKALVGSFFYKPANGDLVD